MTAAPSARHILVNRRFRLAIMVAVIMALVVCMLAMGVVSLTPEQIVIDENVPLPPTTTPGPTRF
jgi:hypothetical protein